MKFYALSGVSTCLTEWLGEYFWLIEAPEGAKKRRERYKQLESVDQSFNDIRRAARRRFSAEEKNWIVLEGLCGDAVALKEVVPELTLKSRPLK